jgi:hypothetical protein
MGEDRDGPSPLKRRKKPKLRDQEDPLQGPDVTTVNCYVGKMSGAALAERFFKGLYCTECTHYHPA